MPCRNAFLPVLAVALSFASVACGSRTPAIGGRDGHDPDPTLSGAALTAELPEPIAHLADDDGFVYGVGKSAIVRIDKASLTAERLVALPGASDVTLAGGVAVDATSVYWTNTGSAEAVGVWSAPKDGSGAAVRIAAPREGGELGMLVLLGGRVYFMESVTAPPFRSTVRSVATTGGAIEDLASGNLMQSFAVDEESVFLCAGTTVSRVSRKDATQTALHVSNRSCRNVGLEGSRTISSPSTNGSALEDLLTIRYAPGTKGVAPSALLADPHRRYIADAWGDSSGLTHSVLRVIER